MISASMMRATRARTEKGGRASRPGQEVKMKGRRPIAQSPRVIEHEQVGGREQVAVGRGHLAQQPRDGAVELGVQQVRAGQDVLHKLSVDEIGERDEPQYGTAGTTSKDC
jgi:hypothetical protein